jgi:CBS-domain-containing membrane protein
VYDYAAGKTDWLAFGLPAEGDGGPFAGELAEPAVTCRPDEPAATVVQRLNDTGLSDTQIVVVLDCAGLVIGAADETELRRADPGAPLSAVMRLAPRTFRPSEPARDLAHHLWERKRLRATITTPDGRLVGEVHRDALVRAGSR